MRKIFVRNLFNRVCVCARIWLLHIGQKNMSDPLRLEVIVSCPTWESSPWSSIPNKKSISMCKGLKIVMREFTPNRTDPKKELDRSWFGCFQSFLACFGEFSLMKNLEYPLVMFWCGLFHSVSNSTGLSMW